MSYQEQTTVNQTVAPMRDEKLATHDLWDTAAADGFTVFLDLLKAAGLDPVLHGPDLVTVFAPTNEAFRALGREPVDQASCHVVEGALTEADLRTADHVKTIDGKALPVTHDADGVHVAGARLVRSDIACTNGVLHAVDAVLQG